MVFTVNQSNDKTNQILIHLWHREIEGTVFGWLVERIIHNIINLFDFQSVTWHSGIILLYTILLVVNAQWSEYYSWITGSHRGEAVISQWHVFIKRITSDQQGLYSVCCTQMIQDLFQIGPLFLWKVMGIILLFTSRCFLGYESQLRVCSTYSTVTSKNCPESLILLLIWPRNTSSV